MLLILVVCFFGFSLAGNPNHHVNKRNFFQNSFGQPSFFNTGFKKFFIPENPNYPQVKQKNSTTTDPEATTIKEYAPKPGKNKNYKRNIIFTQLPPDYSVIKNRFWGGEATTIEEHTSKTSTTILTNKRKRIVKQLRLHSSAIMEIHSNRKTTTIEEYTSKPGTVNDITKFVRTQNSDQKRTPPDLKKNK